MYRNKELVKAIAFAVYVKSKVTSSTVTHYTVNRLHSITGVCASAIEKRLHVLKEYGLIEFTGKGDRCLVFKKISSKCNSRNIELREVDMTSPREIEKSLRAMLVVGIQIRKDYASRLIRLCHDGKNYKEVRKGQSGCKEYGYNGEYIENGLSYEGIARRLGVSVKTAFETVKYAIGHHYLRKHRNIVQFFVRGIGKIGTKLLQFAQNCFFTQNNWYKVYANTYSINSRIIAW